MQPGLCPVGDSLCAMGRVVRLVAAGTARPRGGPQGAQQAAETAPREQPGGQAERALQVRLADAGAGEHGQGSGGDYRGKAMSGQAEGERQEGDRPGQ